VRCPRDTAAFWGRADMPALGFLARLRQQVERALDAGDHAGGDAGVAGRRVRRLRTTACQLCPQFRVYCCIAVSEAVGQCTKSLRDSPLTRGACPRAR
jgi:hypothetical protein